MICVGESHFQESRIFDFSVSSLVVVVVVVGACE